jgi:hypothetical protein
MHLTLDRLAVVTVCIFVSAFALASDRPYSSVADHDFPRAVLWGDTHVHTSYSTGDANLLGRNTVSPEIAYRFARGETVTAVNGERVRLRRPLDFLVIADHAENLGVAFDLQTRHQALINAPGGPELLARYQAYAKDRSNRLAIDGKQLGERYEQSVWQRVVARADAYNDPGKFTAFAGYEWTSAGTYANVFGNLHRVVVFKDGAEKTSKIVPFGANDSRIPEDLWRFLDGYEKAQAGQAISIPHNPNLSNGQMFALTDARDRPLTSAYAELRSRFEPLMEITQFKGDSEAHPALSTRDEFADFETWHSWGGDSFTPDQHPCCRNVPEGDPMERKRGEYARAALLRGLELGAELGTNPFKLGFIGSTDTHSSLSTADSDNYWGKYSSDYPKPSRMVDSRSSGWPTPFWNMSPAGYAGVWATHNTRSAIFAALKRREVYASTGPRITLRFFGGWHFQASDAVAPDVPLTGYKKGVAMGADLSTAPDSRAPSFLVHAARDPEGANLDRIQIIKGWLAADGAHERVYNVAASDNRRIRNGSVAPVGSSVNVATATYENTIGDPELAVVWQDPDFDPTQAAFYYVRVLEIPTPRWTAYDAVRFGLTDVPDEIPMTTQERAYSSPIWYSP